MTEEVQEQGIAEEAVVEHVEQVTEPVAAPVREWSDDDADEAKAFGWKSPDEWQGDVPAGYIDDPRRYLERAENFRPFKALKQRMEKTETDYADRIRKLETVSEQAMRAQRDQYQREIDSIRAQKRAAVDSADTEAYDALEQREKSLAPPSQPQAQQQQENPYIAEYSKANDWIKNPILRKTGADLINAAGLNNAPVEEQVRYAEAEVRKMYPAYFPAKQEEAKTTPPPQGRVDAGGLASGIAKGGAFAKLPPEAKGAFKKFVGEGLFKDSEDDRKRYADDYNAA